MLGSRASLKISRRSATNRASRKRSSPSRQTKGNSTSKGRTASGKMRAVGLVRFAEKRLMSGGRCGPRALAKERTLSRERRLQRKRLAKLKKHGRREAQKELGKKRVVMQVGALPRQPAMVGRARLHKTFRARAGKRRQKTARGTGFGTPLAV